MRSMIGAVLAAGLLAGAGAAAARGFGMGRFDEQGGEAIWKNVCQGCHMPNAKGAVGAGYYPALAGDPKLGSSLYPVYVLLHGQKGMPNFSDMMDDAQIAAIVNYVRSNFGNHWKDQVSADQVASLRAAK